MIAVTYDQMLGRTRRPKTATISTDEPVKDRRLALACPNVNTIAELATARALVKALKPGTALRNAALHGARLDERPAVIKRMRELGLLYGGEHDYTPTSLARRIRDGWTCERCDKWHDHPSVEPYYSANHCNTTGRDLVLCAPCCTKADEEGKPPT